jgi:signal transduction histidine kinase
MREGRWLNVAAVVTWLICGLPQLMAIAQGAFGGSPAAIWLSAYGLYGAALLALLGLVGAGFLQTRYTPLLLVVVEIATALTVITLSVRYRYGANTTPALLVVVAAILPYLAPSSSSSARPRSQVTLTPAWIWSMVASLALANMMVLVILDYGWTATLTFGLSMGGFMLFAAASSFLVRSEAAAREQLAAANAELLGTRALLAENSRAEERLRISRDLHDALGHHLTALSLQLDVASRLSEGKAADHLHQAHAIARLLLGDVRDVVGRLRERGKLDLADAIRSLAGPAEAGHYDRHAEAGHSDRHAEAGHSDRHAEAGHDDRPAKAGHDDSVAIHLDLPDTLAVEDVSRAEILLRCVQEIITNTARHAQARNLWIRLEVRPEGIAVHARDDGHGAEGVICGNGLTGMRERFEMCAGHVEFSTAHGAGFEVRGFLPTPAIA